MASATARPGLRTAAVAALVALSLLVFGQVRHHPFIGLDDTRDIAGNAQVRAGLTLAGARWAFSVGHPPYWHPLTTLSHMGDVALFGLDAGRHLLVNVALHAATAALFFWAVGVATGRWWTAALAAALFVVHPLRVESVAWAAERKDVLSGVFCMLALLAAVRHGRRPSAGRFAALVVLLVAGLLAKPVLVTLPAALLAIEFWPLGRLRASGAGRPLAEKLALSIAAVPVGLVTWAVVRQTTFAERSFPPLERFANAAVSATVYLGKAVWPAKLAVFYPHPASLGSGTPVWQALGATVLLAGISVVAWRSRSQRPWLLAGWCWYLALLAPALGILQNWEQARADRFTYLPLAGFFWAVAEEARLLAARRPAVRPAVVSLALAVLATLATGAHRQTALWRSPEALFSHALAVTEDNWLASAQLGVVLMRQGRYDEAEPLLRRAIALRPLYPTARNNLAILLDRTGRRQEAAREYETAILQDPTYAEARLNLGTLRLREGKVAAAAEAYRAALKAKPDFAAAHFNLGLALEAMGEREDARVHYREAERLDPANRDAAAALRRLGGP